MDDYWRDLSLGEAIQAGDRFYNPVDGWTQIEESHLDTWNTVTKLHGLIQRKADCVPPNENGQNRYGVDISYFRRTINRELNRDLSCFRPDELARVLARLSVTADSQVISEEEFQRRILQ